jgi:hypothetical protein
MMLLHPIKLKQYLQYKKNKYVFYLAATAIHKNNVCAANKMKSIYKILWENYF